MAKDQSDVLTVELLDKPKRGRPVTGTAMTAAQRQKASRRFNKKLAWEGVNAKQISMMLSAQATHALESLSIIGDKSQKETIERLLIEAYHQSRLEQYKKGK